MNEPIQYSKIALATEFRRAFDCDTFTLMVREVFDKLAQVSGYEITVTRNADRVGWFHKFSLIDTMGEIQERIAHAQALFKRFPPEETFKPDAN